MPVYSPRDRLWLDFFDQTVPTYVKETYSPDARWKSKPFSKEDARFFSKGVKELSEQFTEGRGDSRQMQSYLQQAKFRSSYLLYFLPLQAAKFLTLFEQNPKALAALTAGEQPELSVWDFGAGPGTASLALLLALSQQSELPRKITFHWVDTQAAILKDGVALLERFIELVPQWRDRVTVQTHHRNWWDTTALLEKNAVDLALFGNVLNEAPQQTPRLPEFWELLLRRAGRAGVLWLEPADRRSSQLLSQLRDQALEEGWIATQPTAIWGPCLHAGRCPLATGRDWCHTSVEREIPGQWFRAFSLSLGSLREWIKYSYFWAAAAQAPAPQPEAGLFRLLSDPLTDGTSLLCQPERPIKKKINRNEKFQGEARRRGHFWGRGSLWSENTPAIIPVEPKDRPAEKRSTHRTASPDRTSERLGKGLPPRRKKGRN